MAPEGGFDAALKRTNMAPLLFAMMAPLQTSVGSLPLQSAIEEVLAHAPVVLQRNHKNDEAAMSAVVTASRNLFSDSKWKRIKQPERAQVVASIQESGTALLV